MLKLIPFVSLATLLAVSGSQADEKLELLSPVECEIGSDCFLQNYIDLDASDNIVDPYCERAAYNGHKGTDIRLRTVKDLQANVAVIAAAKGVVAGVRNTQQDKLIEGEADLKAVSGIECGNGVVLRHSGGYETQYCHLKRGSITVKSGQTVEPGDTLGVMGLSGLTEFPHVHFSVRHNDVPIDPITGAKSGEGCVSDENARGLFQPTLSKRLHESHTTILASGVTGERPVHKDLVKGNLPKELTSSSSIMLGWAWMTNVYKGDVIRIKLTGPDGLVTEHATPAFERHQAAYSLFTGKRRQAKPGAYEVVTEIVRNGKVVAENRSKQVVSN